MGRASQHRTLGVRTVWFGGRSRHTGSMRSRPRPAAVAIAAVVCLLGVVVAGCGDDEPDGIGTPTDRTTETTAPDAAEPDGTDPGGERPRTGGEDEASPGAARVIGRAAPDQGVPLSDGDFADPFVLDTGLVPIGFTSNTVKANVPVSRPGLLGGLELGEALPEVGSWSEAGFVWAPSVLRMSADRFVLYYTSRDRASGRQCIGAAVADNAIGPYTDPSAEPFICQRVLGGSIDASPATIDGVSYLLWKSDGNCCGMPTSIWIQQLGSDGTSLVGQPTPLVVNDQDWEGPLVEGPSMIKVGDTIHLFYSANTWDTGDYAIGHAVCATATGPCTKDPEPFLASGEEFSGPGGQEFFTDRAGSVWMVFHGWLPGQVGYAKGGTRRLFVEQVTFDASGRPTLTPGD